MLPALRTITIGAIATFLPFSHTLSVEGSEEFYAFAQSLDHLNALAIPKAGSQRLHVLSPNLIECRLYTSQAIGDSGPSHWDWFQGSPDDSGDAERNERFPSPNRIQVLVNGETVAVSQVGFKRSLRHAALKGETILMENALFVETSEPIPSGASIVIAVPDTPETFSGVYNSSAWSPAIHANQTGYEPGQQKIATVGYWLGDLGELEIDQHQSFEILDATTGEVAFTALLALRTDSDFGSSAPDYRHVYQADFTALTTVGNYVVHVPQTGTSYPFRIDEGISGTLARTYAHGLYHMRSGAAKELPWSRFEDPAGHTAPAQIPSDDAEFNRSWELIEKFTESTSDSQTAPRLDRNRDNQLYPFVQKGTVDVSGGHMDAGDYSKYTTNTAETLHLLTFATDYLTGVSGLDNLGLPESGDGISDFLQEAKVEADFLAKMQDEDGGFYFIVYPKERKYESDVMPSQGDSQIVFPKNTSATAAATAALAETASSPHMQKHFPEAAAIYRKKALKGWEFLTNAIDEHGKEGAYQYVTFYGNKWEHDDELAWAAAAMFSMTGDAEYQSKLMEWVPDPSSNELKQWGWRRLEEGWGNAFRCYAFAAHSGRVEESLFDQEYLEFIQHELIAGGDDMVEYTNDSAYGVAFPYSSKRSKRIGWFFADAVVFDAAVAWELTKDSRYLDAIDQNISYVLGTNARNISFVSGMGWKWQHNLVSQFAQNDFAQLPPIGMPVGVLQEGPTYQGNYVDGGTNYLRFANYPSTQPMYDRWSDSFNIPQEMTIPNLARSSSVAAFRFAASSLKDQPWNSGSASLVNLPSIADLGTPLSLEVTSDFDLSEARVTWDITGTGPIHGNPVSIIPENTGTTMVQADIVLPDGRRLYTSGRFTGRKIATNEIDNFYDGSIADEASLRVWYPLDRDFANATTGDQSLILFNNKAPKIDTSSFRWESRPEGGALRIDGYGDGASVELPADLINVEEHHASFRVEAMLYIKEFSAYGKGHGDILRFKRSNHRDLRFYDSKWDGLNLKSGQNSLLETDQLKDIAKNEWIHLEIIVSEHGVELRINGEQIGISPADNLEIWKGETQSGTLTIGNFDGWIDEVMVHVSDTYTPPSGIQPKPEPEDPELPQHPQTYVPKLNMKPGQALVARYDFEQTLEETTRKQESLTKSGSPTLTKEGTIRFEKLDDLLKVEIPGGDLYEDGVSSIELHLRIRVDSYLSYGKQNITLAGIQGSWRNQIALAQGKWGKSSSFEGGESGTQLDEDAMESQIIPKQWHDLVIGISISGYHLTLDNQLIASRLNAADFTLWDRTNSSTLSLGGFAGEIDSVSVISVHQDHQKAWLRSYFATTETPGLQNFDETNSDPDRDGLDNLLEYAFGYSPLEAQPPASHLERTPEGMAFKFSRSFNAKDLPFTIESTSDFVTWQTELEIEGETMIRNHPEIEVQTRLINEEELAETFEVKLPENGSQRFYRLSVDNS